MFFQMYSLWLSFESIAVISLLISRIFYLEGLLKHIISENVTGLIL